MKFTKGDSPIPGYTVGYPVKEARNAETYQVENTAGEACFLKVFRPESMKDGECDDDGMPKELKILENLNHKGIVRLLQKGTIDLSGVAHPYGVFEFIQGETLLDLRRRFAARRPSKVKALMVQLLEATKYLHAEKRILHNQLELTNIMVTSNEKGEEQLKLIDFGFASAFDFENEKELGSFGGHDPNFVAEECYSGRFSSQSDVFALGIIYFKLTFGMNPWEEIQNRRAELTANDIKKIRQQDIRIPDLGSALMPPKEDLEVILKAMSPQRQHRFNSAREMLEALTGKSNTKVEFVTKSVHSEVESDGALKGFDAIAGMAGLKITLIDEVLGPLRNPKKFAEYGLTIPNGLLLYGPPGCGKTYISERFAEEAKLPFKKIIPSDLASIYIHGSQEKIGQLFDEAKKAAPCILFFDELDALLPKRDGGNTNPNVASEVNEFLAQMSNCSEEGVFIIGATNRPHFIDDAVLRSGRMDKKVYVAPPDYDARKAMFVLHLANRPIDKGLDYDELAALTENRVSSDVKLIVDDASRKALRNDTRITQKELISAIQDVPSSLSSGVLEGYQSVDATMSGKADLNSGARERIGFKLGN